MEEVEEEEPPVLALDLRIGKAAESISIFDDKNVLASTSSGFGLALPRPSQTRLCSLFPSAAPYIATLPNQQKSTTMSSDPLSLSSNEPRLYWQSQNVLPRLIDIRKERFLDGPLTPSPPPPSSPPCTCTPPAASPVFNSPRFESTGLLPNHYLLENNYGLSRQHIYSRCQCQQHFMSSFFCA